MSNALKDYLRSLATGQNNPVATFGHFYDAAQKRKQNLVATELKKKLLEQVQIPNAVTNAENASIERGKLSENVRQHSPTFLDQIETRKRQTNAEKDAGFGGYGATTDPIPGRPHQPGTLYTNEDYAATQPRAPTTGEARQRMAARFGAKQMIKAAAGGEEQKMREGAKTDAMRTRKSENLSPQLAGLEWRGKNLTRAERGNLKAKEIELSSTQAYGGAVKKRDPAELKGLKDIINGTEGQAEATPQHQSSGLMDFLSGRWFGQGQQPGGQPDPNAMMQEAQGHVNHIIDTPELRGPWLQNAHPDEIQPWLEQLHQMAASGQLSQEEIQILVSRGF